MRRRKLHGDGCFQSVFWDDEKETEKQAIQRHLDSGQCEAKRPPPVRKEKPNIVDRSLSNGGYLDM